MPIDLRTDLLMIRLASMNQILDPWVYILLRREVVWKVASTLKKIFCCKSDQELQLMLAFEIRQRTTGFVSPSATNTSNESPTCWSFCWHCMCDPPQNVRQSSISSFYNEYGRNSVFSNSPRSPTKKLLINITNNIIIPGGSPAPSVDHSADSPVVRCKYSQDNNDESATELQLLQPKSIQTDKTQIHSINGTVKSFSPSETCETSLDSHRTDICNGAS